MKKLRFKLILPLLLAFVLALGNCMTVCAAGPCPYPENFDDLGYVVILQRVDYPDNYTILTSDAPCTARQYSPKNLQLCFFNSTKYHEWSYVSSTGVFTDYGLKTSSDYVIQHLGSFSSVSYSSHDIYYGDGSLFFRSPLARLAVPLKAEVLKQTKIILPVGVGCLALLIGSVVLLPRLRRSLLRL